MGRRLPPFAAIKAFEAAARYCNFQQAAEELHISPSAVSHQIKSLEDFVGIALFIRNNNRLTLTHDGKAYYKELQQSLDGIERATNAVMRPRGHGELTISLFPTLAELWLIPRLGAFHDDHPNVTIRLSSNTDKSNEFPPDGVDLSIRYIHEDDPDDEGDFLFPEIMIPVCSRAYLESHGPIESEEDLLERTLIYCNWERDEWPFWFGDVGKSTANAKSWLELDTRGHALKAASEGLGIAMGRRPFVDDALVSGRLVTPLMRPVSTGFRYFLTASRQSSDFAGVRRFREWLLSICPSEESLLVA